MHCGEVFQLGAKGKGKKEKVVEASSLVEVKGLRGASTCVVLVLRIVHKNGRTIWDVARF